MATKWWLISNVDVQQIRQELTGSALHTLDSGLHITNAVPDDWKDSEAEARANRLVYYRNVPKRIRQQSESDDDGWDEEE